MSWLGRRQKRRLGLWLRRTPRSARSLGQQRERSCDSSSIQKGFTSNAASDGRLVNILDAAWDVRQLDQVMVKAATIALETMLLVDEDDEGESSKSRSQDLCGLLLSACQHMSMK